MTTPSMLPSQRPIPQGPKADAQFRFLMKKSGFGWHWTVTDLSNYFCLTGYSFTKPGARWAMRRAQRSLRRSANPRRLEWEE